MAESSGYRSQLQYTTVLSGQTLSSDLHLAAATFVSLYFPAVNSCSAYIQAAPTHPGSYYRVLDNNYTGELAMAIGVGLNVLHLPERLCALEHIKLETGVAQTDTRTIAIVARW